MNTGLTETDAAAGRWVLGLIVVVAIAAGIYYWTQRQAEQPPPAAGTAAAPQEEPSEPAKSIEHPVEAPGIEPLPALGESDEAAASSRRYPVIYRIAPEGGTPQLYGRLPEDCDTEDVTLSLDASTAVCAVVDFKPDVHIVENFDPTLR